MTNSQRRMLFFVVPGAVLVIGLFVIAVGAAAAATGIVLVWVRSRMPDRSEP